MPCVNPSIWAYQKRRRNEACALNPPKVSSIRSAERESYILHFLEISARFLFE
ncbi:hypothetical protein Peur_021205 [Populus x canadensis]